MKLPNYARKYFWEVNARKINYKKNPEYVAARILEYGDFKVSRWLLKNVDNRIIKRVILENRVISLKSRIFWSLYFNLPKKCLRKFYQSKQKALWPY